MEVQRACERLLLQQQTVEPETKVIEINHTGFWFADENKMFSDGIGIKEIGNTFSGFFGCFSKIFYLMIFCPNDR